jgi:hypothetical protein
MLKRSEEACGKKGVRKHCKALNPTNPPPLDPLLLLLLNRARIVSAMP